jgi:hypothetical protein
VEVKHFGFGIGEVAFDGVPDSVPDFIQSLALGENGLSKGAG